LMELRTELDLLLEVAHLQHGIRGADAWKDAAFVSRLAAKMGLTFHLKEVDLPRIQREARKGNLEALARAERYRFFTTVAAERGMDKIATAHTEDDQAETVLMWFLRGAGAKGLGGMTPLRRLEIAGDTGREIQLLRPLLGSSKAEVLAFLEQRNVRYRVDRTNRDTNLLRNWIRLRLIPQVQKRFDVHLPARLAQQAELLRDEQLLLEDLAAQTLGAIRVPGGLNRRLFLEQDKALQRLILRRWIEEAKGDLRGIDFDHIRDLLALIQHETPQGRLSIPGGWELVKEYETLRLGKRSANRPRCDYSYEIELGSDLRVLQAGLVIQSQWISPRLATCPCDLMEAMFDSAGLPDRLTVRNFRYGDRFQPLGMAGHKKIKELFSERRVPMSVRSTVPLLAMGDEILWIPGYGRSDIGKVRPHTEKILLFKALPVKLEEQRRY